MFLALWIFFVLYPNPLNLVISIHRVFNFDVDSSAIEANLEDFPSDPIAIERAVLERIPYRYDWEVYDMPWYFPTLEEILEKKEGDCKARALVLASILEAENIPYRVNVSPIHIWVEYEGKEETSIENTRVKFYQEDPESGKKLFQIPEINLREMMNSIWQGLWVSMPAVRKAVLLSGLLILVGLRVVLFKNRATI